MQARSRPQCASHPADAPASKPPPTGPSTTSGSTPPGGARPPSGRRRPRPAVRVIHFCRRPEPRHLHRRAGPPSEESEVWLNQNFDCRQERELVASSSSQMHTTSTAATCDSSGGSRDETVRVQLFVRGGGRGDCTAAGAVSRLQTGPEFRLSLSGRLPHTAGRCRRPSAWDVSR